MYHGLLTILEINAKKHQHRRLNSYRGDCTHKSKMLKLGKCGKYCLPITFYANLTVATIILLVNTPIRVLTIANPEFKIIILQPPACENKSNNCFYSFNKKIFVLIA